MKKMELKRYSELSKIPKFMDRYEYARIGGSVGIETFGFDRYLNQTLYKSDRWKETRRFVIIRDNGCDLGVPDREIRGRLIVHHLNPITEEDIYNKADWIFDPEFLICVSITTHNAIHYGDKSLLIADPIVRTPNDTCPWR